MTRILVVDDEPSFAQAVRDYLEFEGYDVQTAHDGLGALRTFKSFQPAVMVLDMIMPDENGCRVSRMIKTYGRREGYVVPKIVLVTGKNLSHDPGREETVSRFSMADAVFYKPFDFRELLASIRGLIGEPRPVA